MTLHKLSVSSRWTLIQLAGLTKDFGHVTESKKRLGVLLDMTLPSLCRCLQELIRSGLLCRDRSGLYFPQERRKNRRVQLEIQRSFPKEDL